MASRSHTMRGTSSPQTSEAALQHLWTWILAVRDKFPALTRGVEEETWFIPWEKLEAYMTEERIVNILRAVLRDNDGVLQRIAREVVDKGCVKLFTILAYSNWGALIQSFLERSGTYCDKRLPYKSGVLQSNFPGGKEVFHKIKDLQQHFCVEAMGEQLDQSIPEEYIFPIESKKPIGTGASAEVFEVKLHDGYSAFQQRRRTSHSLGEAENVIVLKTFKNTTDAHQCFQREVRAYNKLREDNPPVQNLIQFYGSFTVHDANDNVCSYNIILEHADGRNLEEFAFHDPTREIPSNARDFWAFWKQLFGLVYAIDRLHNIGIHDPETKTHAFQGMHHDLKPANILVLHESGDESIPTGFPYRFVLADLGLVTLQDAGGSQGNVVRDQRGTIIYGSPYSARHSWQDGWSMSVTSAADIWGVGCIFSEALVWSTLGYAGLIKYRKSRAEESQGRGPVFYDSDARSRSLILKTVAEYHRKAAKARRHGDKLVDELVSLLEDLLVPVEHQMSATALTGKTERILEKTNPWDLIRLNSDSESIITPAVPNGVSHIRIASDSLTGAQNPPTPQRSSIGTSGYPKTSQDTRRSSLRPGTSLDAPAVEQEAYTSRSTEVVRNKAPPPHLSVDKARSLEKQLRAGYTANNPELEHLKQLQGKDCFFIIDNSKSMDKYLPEVKDLVELLACAVKPYDPDRLEYAFMSDNKTRKDNDPTAMKHAVQINHGAAPKTNAAASLERIFDKYGRKYRKWRDNGPSIWGKMKTKYYDEDATYCRPIVFYILTDGVWQPQCPVWESVDRLLKMIHDAPKHHVGISFIQFGSDENGTNRLRALDDGLKEKCSTTKDIVDYERSDGNFLKMLLGSINEWWDHGNESTEEERKKWQWD